MTEKDANITMFCFVLFLIKWALQCSRWIYCLGYLYYRVLGFQLHFHSWSQFPAKEHLGINYLGPWHPCVIPVEFLPCLPGQGQPFRKWTGQPQPIRVSDLFRFLNWLLYSFLTSTSAFVCRLSFSWQTSRSGYVPRDWLSAELPSCF